ncbi:MAG: DNA adenine methylase [Deltaproteobacteria bacterium]|nr:DNA adenine methylase [Deltaproteobacteria bacterium]
MDTDGAQGREGEIETTDGHRWTQIGERVGKGGKTETTDGHRWTQIRHRVGRGELRPPKSTDEPRPFLKWAGGKGQLLEQYGPLFPRRFGRYHEPFVGGGAVFFHLRPPRATLSDDNGELVDCLIAVRDDLPAVIDALGRHVYDKDHYYAVRALSPDELPLAERAARTIYLNRTCFNGLYRVNSKGGFNVPFGRYSNPTICDAPNLRACSRALKRARIERAPFPAVLDRARRGDFVYFDPPYHPLSKTAYFTAYAKGGFREEDQRELARVYSELDRRGVLVMLSNSDTPLVRDIYRGFRIVRVQATRAINSKAARRGAITELVVLNYR